MTHLTTAHWHDPVPPGRLPDIGAPLSGGLPCRLDMGLYPAASRGKHAV